MIKIGIVLIVVSTVIFVAALAVPDALKPLAPLICQPNEQLVSKTYTYSRPGRTSTTVTYACQNSDGVQRDVTGTLTGGAVIAFLVLLFLGVGLTIVGSARAGRRFQTSGWRGSFGQPQINQNPDGSATYSYTVPANNPVSGAAMNDMVAGLQRGVIRFGGQEIHLDDLKSGNYQLDAAQSKRTLAETLRQLEDAHTQGLISDEEYQKLRQDALDKLV